MQKKLCYLFIFLVSNSCYSAGADNADQLEPEAFSVTEIDQRDPAIVKRWENFCATPGTQTLSRTADESKELFVRLLSRKHQFPQIYGATKKHKKKPAGLIAINQEKWWLDDDGKEHTESTASLKLLNLAQTTYKSGVTQALLETFALSEKSRKITTLETLIPLETPWEKESLKDKATSVLLTGLGFTEGPDCREYVVYEMNRLLIPRDIREKIRDLEQRTRDLEETLMPLVDPQIEKNPGYIVGWRDSLPLQRTASFRQAKDLTHPAWTDEELEKAISSRRKKMYENS